MRKPLASVLALLLFAGSASAQRKIDERRAVVPNGFVRIFTLSGSVTVIGWDKDSLAVTGTVWEPSGDRFAIGVTPKGAKLGLWSDTDQKIKPSDITVHVPRLSQVWVKTTDASIRISDVTGGLDLFSVGGSIEIAGAPAEVYAETMAGQIGLHANTASARLKTAAGALQVSGSISDLTAVTVSGPINAASVTFARARLESVDGNIRYTGMLSAGSSLEVTNHAGAIDMLLPRAVAASFSVSLYAGEMRDAFGIGRKLRSGKGTKARELKFSLGKLPAAYVTLKSFKGRVELQKL